MQISPPILHATALFLLVSQPALASLQCGPSDADPTLWIEPVEPSDLRQEAEDESLESQDLAAFRISGVRPRRVSRIGLNRWEEGLETQQPSRPGFASDCEPFEHFLVVSVRESRSGAELSVQYWYDFSEYRSQSEVETLQLSTVSHAEIGRLPATAAIGFEEDLAIWGVFVGAVPEAGESLQETARRADRALLLHLRNSPH